MAWSAGFLGQLRAGGGRLVYAVETWETALGTGVGQPGRVFSSVPLAGAMTWLVPELLEFGYQALTPPGWQYAGSSWRFALATDDPAGLTQAIKRGTLVRLRAGFSGDPYGAWEVIQSGRVQAITYRRGLAIVEVWDLVSSLQSRSDDSSTWCDLFYSVGTSTTISSAYTPGDTSIAVNSTSGFERRTGGTGVIRIEPSGGTPFYLTYTGTTTTSFTGLSATGQFNTTATSASTGQVYEVAYLDDRPDQIAARVLTSTGAGTNGTYDILPRSWGYALPVDMVDTTDMIDQGNALLTVSSGTYAWGVLVEDEQADGLSWLSDLLNPIGVALVQRQGRLSLRIAQDPAAPGVPPSLEITDADVLTEATGADDPAVEWWSQDPPQEYAILAVEGDGGSHTETSSYPGSLPIQGSTETIDLTDRLWANVVAVCTSDAGRLWPWYHRIAEVVSLTLASCWWAQLAPGDLVYLIDGSARGRLETTLMGYSQRVATVLEVRPDWLRARTDLRLAILPLDDADEWRA